MTYYRQENFLRKKYKMDYKNSLNLLDSAFPMRGDLAKREPLFLDTLYRLNVYQNVRELAKGRSKFILHDGPPYANGDIHLGHSVNKVLKDIIIRNKTIAGFDAPYIPGWDCHGLPIELNVEKMLGKNVPKDAKFFQTCRDYASSQVDKQKIDFKRLGILGDWDKPYRTMDFATEANIVRALGEIYKNNYLMSGFKPVHWCIDCGSALAEAEIEYYDKESPAIDVAFNAVDIAKVAKCFNTFVDAEIVSAVIWTTTPWTLPANQAICGGPEIEYALISTESRYFIVAKALVEDCMKRYGINEYRIEAVTTGTQLELLEFKHPFYNRHVPFILGEHATDDAGTGLVHTAPAHGLEDFVVGKKYNLDITNPVGDDGKYLANVEIFAGVNVFDANIKVVEVLQQAAALLANNKLKHSYPCCWRHKSKIIFRTTKQWFIAMDRPNVSGGTTLREKAKEQIDKVNFYPDWGYARLDSMIKNRPDWCISRQRTWNVPMTFLINKITGELHPNSYTILQKVAKIIAENGIESWKNIPLTELIDDSEVSQYSKLSDTLDVWFDSGVTHYSVIDTRDELSYPADLYLEGSDQHRGWFQSSLLTACAIKGTAPYKALLTHGFTVDANGRKMSKSLGNTISPSQIINKYGADMLRLWVASTDYSGELAISEEILKRTSDSYRRIRNTLKFLLANLVDFDYRADNIPTNTLLDVDKYALIRLEEVKNKVLNDYYPRYQFHLIVQELVNYCSEDLGSFYLDILKDRLYTSSPNSLIRRSAQNVLHRIAHDLVLMLSPILSFTAEEAWHSLYGNENDFTLYHTYQFDNNITDSERITTRWNMVSELRQIILKELEAKRTEGLIGSSLQAELELVLPERFYNEVKQLGDEIKFAYMVSSVRITLGGVLAVNVVVTDQEKCDRCWHYEDSVGSDQNHPSICKRCVDSIENTSTTRLFV